MIALACVLLALRWAVCPRAAVAELAAIAAGLGLGTMGGAILRVVGL